MLLLEDKVSKLINEIDKIMPEHLYMDESQGECISFNNIAYYLQKLVSKDIVAEQGASKGVIIPSSCGYVIKLPFEGTSYDYLNSETGEYEEEHEAYCWANDFDDYFDDDSWNYCANEVSKYEEAVAEGFADFFPKTMFYGFVGGHPLYIQEKVKPFHDIDIKKGPSEKAREEYNSNDKVRYIADSTWTQFLIDRFGIDRVLAFSDFLEKWDIADLHTGNLGFKYDGTPCILDFSGFRD